MTCHSEAEEAAVPQTDRPKAAIIPRLCVVYLKTCLAETNYLVNSFVRIVPFRDNV